jgi:hypothetical protein
MNTTHTTCSCGCTGSHACDCCTGPHVSTPQIIFNPSGLDAIQRRAGTWGSFRSTMQARLSSTAEFPALKNLTTREPDDPSIAFLDAAAVVCDVLTFYSERFANEGYLRTATQRRSLMELGKLVGYKPRPGVAASAWLAFTLDTDYAIEIPAGTRVQSVPGAPGETAQTFETTDALSARYELNAMPARRSVPQEISPANVLSIETIWLKGTGLNLKPGDMLLFAFPNDESASKPRRVHTVTEDAEAQRTTVKLVVEKLSGAYYLPVLRKAAEAARKSLPDAWLTDSRAWAKNAAVSLDKFSTLLASDLALLDIEKEITTGASTAIHTALPAFVSEGAAASAYGDGLTRAKNWSGELHSKWENAFAAAADQEKLILEVFAQLAAVDEGQAPLPSRQLAAKRIGQLLAPGTSSPGRIDSCVATVRSAAALLKAAADLAADATSEAIWSGTGIATPGSPSRTGFTKLGAVDPVKSVRTSGMEFLANAATELADGTADLADTANVLLDSGGNSFSNVISTATGAANASVREVFTQLQEVFRGHWAAQEDRIRVELSATATTDAFLKSLGEEGDDIRAQLPALNLSHKNRATGYAAASGEYESLYTTVTSGVENGAHLAALTAAGISADALSSRLEEFSASSAAGLAASILLLAGRYNELRNEGADGVTADQKLDALVALLDTPAKDSLVELHAELKTLRDALEPIAKTTTSTVLRRLDAEVRILSDQVSVSPGGVTSTVVTGASSQSAALGEIVASETLKQPAAPGDPLSVARSLASFLPGAGNGTGGTASDAVSRLAGRLAGTTDDELFEAWAALNTGTPVVEVYALRVQTSVFGSGAPMRFGEAADKSFDKRFTSPSGQGDWTIDTGDDGEVLRLDGEHGKVVRDSYVVIERPRTFKQPASVQAKSLAAPALSGGFFPAVNELKLFLFSGVIQKSFGGDEVTEVTDTLVRRVREVASAPHSAYSLSGKATTVSLLQDKEWGKDATLGFGVIRRTKIHAASELLTLAEMPVDRVAGLERKRKADGSFAKDQTNPFSESDDTLMLGGLFRGLVSGHRLIVSGERVDSVSKRQVREYALVSSVEHVLTPSAANSKIPLPGDKAHTRIKLSKALQYQYQRSTVTVYGNVAEATHGETKRETLGSGNARAVSQRFGLRSTPLTYIAAATASGAESTAELRVDRVLWKEVEQFTNAEPDDRVYMLDIADDGTTQAVFGDGKRGARLPTGVENVAAVYRQGIGQAGNVGAETMTTLLDRPLGLKEVINPLAASGGADRDSAEDIRQNAPLPLLALDRLVSVSDYAAFSRAFAGIGKAEAALLGGGGGNFVHVTIAGQDDALITEDSSLMSSLTDALVLLGDPLLPVRVQSRELLVLLLSAGVHIAPDYAWADVEPALRAAVLAAFGFDRRAPGQDVFLSEVITVMHRVPGVDYVDVDSFGGIPEKKEAMVDGVAARSALTPEELEAAITGIMFEPPPNPLSDPPPPPKPRPPQQRVTVNLAGYDPLGSLRPAQLALFLSDMPETLILNQIVS